MSTMKTTSVPASITTWITARRDPEQAHLLPQTLAEDVRFTFAGRRRTGRADVTQYLEASPSSALSNAEHEVISHGEDRYTVRFTGPGGAHLPSPGGPMAAMDFLMTLDQRGQIATLTPHPHHTEPADLQSPLAPGAVLPDFTLPDAHGTPVPWRDPAATAHVVLFTCNGCPWALGWHDRIQDVARDYAAQGVRVVQINANDIAISPSDAPERSRARVDAGEFAGPYLLDEGQVIARQLGARHTPEIFLVDGTGTVAYHGAPDADSEEPSLRAIWLRDALDAVLSGRPPTLRETEPIGCTVKWTM